MVVRVAEIRFVSVAGIPHLKMTSIWKLAGRKRVTIGLPVLLNAIMTKDVKINALKILKYNTKIVLARLLSVVFHYFDSFLE